MLNHRNTFLAAIAAALCFPASSLAAQVYAAPAPHGAGDCSSPANACSIYTAFGALETGDELILAGERGHLRHRERAADPDARAAAGPRGDRHPRRGGPADAGDLLEREPGHVPPGLDQRPGLHGLRPRSRGPEFHQRQRPGYRRLGRPCAGARDRPERDRLQPRRRPGHHRDGHRHGLHRRRALRRRAVVAEQRARRRHSSCSATTRVETPGHGRSGADRQRRPRGADDRRRDERDRTRWRRRRRGLRRFAQHAGADRSITRTTPPPATRARARRSRPRAQRRTSRRPRSS